MRILRESIGLSRKEFGKLFSSKENTVGEWENGHSIPKLFKLMSITGYFGISLDCLISGRISGNNILEERLIQIGENNNFEPNYSHGIGQMISQFYSLPNRHKERFIGYLEALCNER